MNIYENSYPNSREQSKKNSKAKEQLFNIAHNYPFSRNNEIENVLSTSDLETPRD